MLTDDGPVRIEVPRDRAGEFEPRLIGKHERRFIGFDDKIIAMYARGMTVREIQGFPAEMYATDVTPDFISTVTDAVLSEVTAWQARPLEPMYPVIFFDALRVKSREDNVVRNKPIYTAASAEAAQAELEAFEAGPWGTEISDRGGILAAGLVECDSVLRLSAAGAPGALHHQRDRERERAAAQHHREMEPWGARLEGGDEPIRDSLSRPLHAAKSVRCFSTDFPTASVVRRKRRPPPWKSLQRLTHRIQDTSAAACTRASLAAIPLLTRVIFSASHPRR